MHIAFYPSYYTFSLEFWSSQIQSLATINHCSGQQLNSLQSTRYFRSRWRCMDSRCELRI